MPQPLHLISVRLDPATLQLLDHLVAHPRKLAADRRLAAMPTHYNRSDLIRHAVQAGLDLLTQSDPLKL